MSLVCARVCVSCRLCFILELKTAEGWFFQRVYLCTWVIGGHELGTPSIRVHNSLTVHDNSWALKFSNFSEFQNVISDSPPSPNPPASLRRFAYESRFVTNPLRIHVVIIMVYWINYRRMYYFTFWHNLITKPCFRMTFYIN